MNWDAIGAIGEIVGAIAVFATLVYLAIQVRTNAKMIQSQNIHSTTTGLQTWTELGTRPELARVISKALKEEELDEIEALMLEGYVGLALAQFWSRYKHHQEGLPALSWEKTRLLIGDFVKIPWVKLWWQEYARARYDDDFATEVDAIIEDDLGDKDYYRILYGRGDA